MPFAKQQIAPSVSYYLGPSFWVSTDSITDLDDIDVTIKDLPLGRKSILIIRDRTNATKETTMTWRRDLVLPKVKYSMLLMRGIIVAAAPFSVPRIAETRFE